MRKFSKINEKEVVQDKPELQGLKYKILDLMSNTLSIQSYGSARAELLNSSLSIAGKEDFVSALMDLITGDSILKLESLKSETKDWAFLDKEINKLQEINLSENKNIVKKISSFLETYKTNKDFDVVLESHVNRITDKKDIYNRIEVISKMMTNENYKLLSNLSKLKTAYSERYKDLK